MKVILNVGLQKYINDGNCDYLNCYYWVENHALLGLLLGHFTKHNAVKSSTCVNPGNDEART